MNTIISVTVTEHEADILNIHQSKKIYRYPVFARRKNIKSIIDKTLITQSWFACDEVIDYIDYLIACEKNPPIRFTKKVRTGNRMMIYYGNQLTIEIECRLSYTHVINPDKFIPDCRVDTFGQFHIIDNRQQEIEKVEIPF